MVILFSVGGQGVRGKGQKKRCPRVQMKASVWIKELLGPEWRAC